MSAVSQPIVYISYRWVDVDDQARPTRAPDPRARELADELRARGIDVRLDIYFRDNLHGKKPPQRVAGSPQDPWLTWSAEQIDDADAVLMLCTPEYADVDPDRGEIQGEWWKWSQLNEADRIAMHVPALWWDWLAIARECGERPQKFILVGTSPYQSDQIPGFVRGASYLNLSDDGAFDALVRRIRAVWRERAPRRGVFISYAHKDDQSWLDDLLTHLSWLRRRKVELWTDRDIEPGEKWHEAIQAALDRAKVAVLLVSPEFLDSDYVNTKELPEMLEAAESDGMKIFWIPLRPSSYKRSPIVKFQAAHAPDRPLSALSDAARDQAFTEISDKLAKVLGVLGQETAAAAPTAAGTGTSHRPAEPQPSTEVTRTASAPRSGEPVRPGSKKTLDILKIVIPALAAIVVAAIQFCPRVPDPQPGSNKILSTSYVGRVIDEESLKPIAKAEIQVDGAGFYSTVYSDSKGVYRVELPQGSTLSSLRARVFAVDYEPYDRVLSPASKGQIEEIRLRTSDALPDPQKKIVRLRYSVKVIKGEKELGTWLDYKAYSGDELVASLRSGQQEEWRAEHQDVRDLTLLRRVSAEECSNLFFEIENTHPWDRVTVDVKVEAWVNGGQPIPLLRTSSKLGHDSEITMRKQADMSACTSLQQGS